MSRRRVSGPSGPRKAKTAKQPGQLSRHHPYQFYVFNPHLYTSHHLGMGQKRELGEDRISQLPTDIRAAILSRLTLEEAGRTSVLSRNWRNLWGLHATRLDFGFARLNFDPVSKRVITKPFYRQVDIAKYVSRVNQVLKLHQGAFVDEFVIHCPLVEATYSRYITTWVLFAFQKGVKSFVLDLEGVLSEGRGSWYAFPLLGIGHMERTARPAGFCCLVSLCLRHVNITGEVVENFLANCPLLEQLQLKHAYNLKHLRVAGSSLKLKSLEINCCCLDVLEISAVNLVSLTYVGRISMLLKNIPVLSHYCIGGDYGGSVIERPRDHLSYLRQLESLKLSLATYTVRRYMIPETFPQLCYLKKLDLEVPKAPGDNLICYTPLLMACPSLSKFKVQYLERGFPGHDGIIARQNTKRLQHKCLKVVEVVGFQGNADEFEFLSYLLVIAVSLEELIINPYNPLILAIGLHENFIIKQEVRESARQLERELPPKVKLVIL